MNFPLVNYTKETKQDKENFAYAICSCLPTVCDCFKIPKSHTKDWEFFNCPYCNEKIGIYIGYNIINVI